MFVIEKYWKVLNKIFIIEKKYIDNQYNTIAYKISYWTSINNNILIDIEKYWIFQYFSIDADAYVIFYKSIKK